MKKEWKDSRREVLCDQHESRRLGNGVRTQAELETLYGIQVVTRRLDTYKIKGQGNPGMNGAVGSLAVHKRRLNGAGHGGLL